jgi:hypothetical protein
MKTLNIEIPEGHEVDLVKSNLVNGFVAFKKIEPKLPKTWGDLENISGYFVGDCCSIEHEIVTKTYIGNKNLFLTKEQAEASLAFSQLSQLREVYRQGWIPNWNTETELKFCICYTDGNLTIKCARIHSYFLSFQSLEVAEPFLQNFKALIEKVKPLMS